jgi:hypothetical protein
MWLVVVPLVWIPSWFQAVKGLRREAGLRPLYSLKPRRRLVVTPLSGDVPLNGLN